MLNHAAPNRHLTSHDFRRLVLFAVWAQAEATYLMTGLGHLQKFSGVGDLVRKDFAETDEITFPKRHFKNGSLFDIIVYQLPPEFIVMN